MGKRNSSESAGRRGSGRSGSGKKSAPRRNPGNSFSKRDSVGDPDKKDGSYSRPRKKSDGGFSKPFDKSNQKGKAFGGAGRKRGDDRTPPKTEDAFTEKRERAPSKKSNNSSADSGKRFSKPFDKSPDRKNKEQYERFAKKPFKSASSKDKDENRDEKKARGFFNPAGSYAPPRLKFKGKPLREEIPNKDSDIIRLNKYISNSGVCSRREADEYIKMGLVSVNGNVITELGYKVKRSDEVRYEDKVLKAEKPVYILMNKPKGFITTTKDPEDRKTIMHIIGNAVKERVYPVGRLDRNTTGLLLLTNDGDLADKLMHPSHNAKKIYKVELDRPLTKADFQKIRDGVHLEEGRAIVDDIAITSDDGKTVGIEIHIGWNRVVRRIFESLLYTVEKLDRTVYAGLDKKDLPRGAWRFLTKEEIVLLKHYK